MYSSIKRLDAWFNKWSESHSQSVPDSVLRDVTDSILTDWQDALEYIRDEGPYDEHAQELARRVLAGEPWREEFTRTSPSN